MNVWDGALRQQPARTSALVRASAGAGCWTGLVARIVLASERKGCRSDREGGREVMLLFVVGRGEREKVGGGEGEEGRREGAATSDSFSPD